MRVVVLCVKLRLVCSIRCANGQKADCSTLLSFVDENNDHRLHQKTVVRSV